MNEHEHAQRGDARGGSTRAAGLGSLLALVLMCSCGAPERSDWIAPDGQASSQPVDVVTAAGSEAAEAALNQALDDLWELQMARFPTWATYEGDRRYDDRLTDLSAAADEAHLTAMEAIAAAVEAIDPALLSPTSRDTRALVLLDVRLSREAQQCHIEWWSINGLDGPQVDYGMLPVFHSIRNETDLANLEARYRATGVQIDQTIANLRRGLDEGYSTARMNVERAINQIDTLLERPIDADPMLVVHSENPDAELDLSGLRDAIETVVRPALARYRDALRDEVLPRSREAVGVSALPDGQTCYRLMMARHIGPDRDPQQLHETGLQQLAWAHRGMLETAVELGIEAETAADVIAAMRSSEAQFGADSETLLRLNSEVVARAAAAMDQAFGRLPETRVEVRPIEDHRSADAVAGYYYSAPEDGSRPAYYYVNTHAPQTRPLYNLEALAFHEAIPGHHLQIALAHELPEFHIWRRSAGQTAFIEGWALYAEVLADEMGLYSSPSTRFGMYNYQAWRASRLVVDTGMHEMGWSRQQALDFLLENTALPENEATNEIDRYIAWPGQALAYMVGRLEIESLRREAEEALGDAFDLRAFHDQVLGNGAVPLSILRVNVRGWIDAHRSVGVDG